MSGEMGRGRPLLYAEANTRRYLWETMNMMNCVLLQAGR